VSWDRLAATLARRAAGLAERRKTHPREDPQRWRDARWLWPHFIAREG